MHTPQKEVRVLWPPKLTLRHADDSQDFLGMAQPRHTPFPKKLLPGENSSKVEVPSKYLHWLHFKDDCAWVCSEQVDNPALHDS